jgi:Ca-activated chloride channel family protein
MLKLALIPLLPWLLMAEQPGPRPDVVKVDLRSDTNLVLVPVTLMDRRGAIVTGLERQHFTVLDDDKPQVISSFSYENVPCTIGVVLDKSGSMRYKLDGAKALADEVIAASEAEDRTFLMTVSDRPEVGTAITADPNIVRVGIHEAQAGGSTALIDTVYLALKRLRSAPTPRKALLVLSDGMDNHSRFSRTELLRVAMEADIQVYTVWMGTPARPKRPISPELRDGYSLSRDLAARTGGLQYVMESPADIRQISSGLSRVLRDQYVLGYIAPRYDEPGKWHQIKVKLDVPKVSVYARNGHYSEP